MQNLFAPPVDWVGEVDRLPVEFKSMEFQGQDYHHTVVMQRLDNGFYEQRALIDWQRAAGEINQIVAFDEWRMARLGWVMRGQPYPAWEKKHGQARRWRDVAQQDSSWDAYLWRQSGLRFWPVGTVRNPL